MVQTLKLLELSPTEQKFQLQTKKISIGSNFFFQTDIETSMRHQNIPCFLRKRIAFVLFNF